MFHQRKFFPQSKMFTHAHWPTHATVCRACTCTTGCNWPHPSHNANKNRRNHGMSIRSMVWDIIITEIRVCKGMELLSECLQKTKCVTANWKVLGLFLTVPKSRLDEIERDKRFAVECMMEMLDTWLKSNPDNPLIKIDDAIRELYKHLLKSK